MNAQDEGDAMPPVQGNERCDADSVGRGTLHQDTRVFQPTHIQDEGGSHKRTKSKTVTIRWNEWNPFERVTGEALRQLNKRQRKQSPLDCVDEALL